MLDTSNFIYAHKALYFTRLLGLFPIHSKLITKRRVLVDKHFNRLLNYFVTLFNCVILVGGIYGIYIAYRLVRNGILPLANLIGLTAAVLTLAMCMCLDYVLNKAPREWCYLINSIIRFKESIEG